MYPTEARSGVGVKIRGLPRLGFIWTPLLLAAAYVGLNFCFLGWLGLVRQPPDAMGWTMTIAGIGMILASVVGLVIKQRIG